MIPAGRAVALLLVVLGLLASGCSTSQSATEPGTTSSETATAAQVKLTATATQYTVDEASGDIRVGIVNAGSGTVTVTSASLDWAGFQPRQVAVPAGTLGPGDVTGVLVKRGAAVCGQPLTSPPRLAVVVDGSTVRIPLRVKVPQLLTMLHSRDCADQRLARTASLTLQPAARPVTIGGQRVLPADIVLRRAQGRLGVTVLELGGSVLLQFAPRDAASLPARLDPGQALLRLPVTLSSAHRCDAHARANSSQTFVLSVDVRLDDQPAQRVVVTPDERTKVALLALIAANCG